MKSIVFVYITERKNILKTPPPIRFIPSPKEVREKMNGILGGAVAVLLEVTFFSFASPEKSDFWRFFATEAFIYCMMDTI